LRQLRPSLREMALLGSSRLDTMRGWRAIVSTLFGFWFARTGPVSIPYGSETVEGGLFMPFGVWVGPNGAVCIADAA